MDCLTAECCAEFFTIFASLHFVAPRLAIKLLSIFAGICSVKGLSVSSSVFAKLNSSGLDHAIEVLQYNFTKLFSLGKIRFNIKIMDGSWMMFVRESVPSESSELYLPFRLPGCKVGYALTDSSSPGTVGPAHGSYRDSAIISSQ